MKKIGIFYGSTTGYTADVASKLANALGVELADVYNVANTAPSKVGDYDVVLFGCSTWGAGDMQADFEDFLDGVQGMYMPGVKVALFGCGDENMAHTFGGALGEIYDRLGKTGMQLIGTFNTDGYTYEESPAFRDGKCVGLIIDDVNHADLTDARVKAWAEQLKKDI